jgi:hypothetical protein
MGWNSNTREFDQLFMNRHLARLVRPSSFHCYCNVTFRSGFNFMENHNWKIEYSWFYEMYFYFIPAMQQLHVYSYLFVQIKSDHQQWLFMGLLITTVCPEYTCTIAERSRSYPYCISNNKLETIESILNWGIISNRVCYFVNPLERGESYQILKKGQ